MSGTKILKKTVITFTIAGTLLINPIIGQAELGDQVLKSGMTHKDVQVLQQHLVDLKYLDLNETTTYYGDQTIKAVMDFQRDHGLKADGIFGQDSFDALSNIVYFEPLVYNRLLKEGISGNDVQALQERLKALGFLDIDNCTNYFGSQTKEALMAFQRAHGIGVDGIAGRESINAINNAFVNNGRKPRPKSASRGSSKSSSTGHNIVATAKTHIGKSYSFGSSNGTTFDCSGFTQYVFKQNGISLPRTSSAQASVGTKVSKSDLQTGDLVIFAGTYGGKTGPSHTGIYIGDGKFIHASSSGKGVMISDLSSGYYNNHFHSGRRLY